MSMEAARNASDIGSERRGAKDDMAKNPAIVPSRKPCAFPVSWTTRVMGCVQTRHFSVRLNLSRAYRWARRNRAMVVEVWEQTSVVIASLGSRGPRVFLRVSLAQLTWTRHRSSMTASSRIQQQPPTKITARALRSRR